jgi:hypothetical protein
LNSNPYLQEALEYSYDTAPTTKPILDTFYHDLPLMFDKQRIRRMVDFTIGIDHLEGWVEQQLNGCRVGMASMVPVWSVRRTGSSRCGGS